MSSYDYESIPNPISVFVGPKQLFDTTVALTGAGKEYYYRTNPVQAHPEQKTQQSAYDMNYSEHAFEQQQILQFQAAQNQNLEDNNLQSLEKMQDGSTFNKSLTKQPKQDRVTRVYTSGYIKWIQNLEKQIAAQTVFDIEKVQNVVAQQAQNFTDTKTLAEAIVNPKQAETERVRRARCFLSSLFLAGKGQVEYKESPDGDLLIKVNMDSQE